MESSTTQTVPRDLRRRSMRYGKQIKTNRDRLLLCGVVLLLAQPAWSQRAVFSGVQIRFSKSGKDRKLIESSGSLIYKTVLSRNAKEIVMYEVQGSYYSDWKRKTP